MRINLRESFDAIVLWISSYSCFYRFVLSIKSALSNLLFIFLMVLSQNVTIWLIKVRVNSFRLEYHLSVNSSWKSSVVGWSVSSKPFWTSLCLMHWESNFCFTYLADFSSNQFSLIGNTSMLCYWPKVGTVKQFRF